MANLEPGNTSLSEGILSSTAELGSIRGISFAYLNIRSLFKSIDEVKLLLKGSKLDVLLLGETFLNNHVSSDILQCEGYDFYRFD